MISLFRVNRRVHIGDVASGAKEVIQVRTPSQEVQVHGDLCGYLGYRIDAEGLHPLPDKVQAVEEAPTPTCLTELKSYLGLLI